MKRYHLTTIPIHVYQRLMPFLYLTRKFSNVDDKDRFFAPLLDRQSLREWLGGREDEYITALKWALEHPTKDYRKFLPSSRKEYFSNEDCLKIFSYFLKSLELLHDEGPDVVQQHPYYIDEPGDLPLFEERT